jgi:peptide/nickel transport system permease protein
MTAVTETLDPKAAIRAARWKEFRSFARRFFRNPLGVVGLVIVVALIVVAAFAPWIATHDPYLPDLGSRLAAPIGLLVGTVAGYAGGWLDTVLMRITDIFLAFPKLILALAFVAALGPGIENAVIAIAITSWPPYARIARAETLTVRNSDYIKAVELMGASPFRIVLRHIMPLCISSLIVRVTLDMAGIILTAAGLGFLGLGAQPPLPEWGAMIASGRRFVLDQWWVAGAPGFAILIVSLGFNLLGDGLRDALDPRSGDQ